MSTKPAEASRPKPTEVKKVHIADTPLTRQNWYKHVNWLNVFLIIGIPLYGTIQSFWVPLQLKTAIWSVVYYFCTGFGITAGLSPHEQISVLWVLTSQATTVCGLTAPIRPPSPFVSGSPSSAVVLFKVPSAGGLVTTAPITAIPTPTRTPIPSARDCSTPTSVGWS